MSGGYRITCDVGGTFTDVVVAEAGGRLTIGKALTHAASGCSTGCAPRSSAAAGQLGPRARRGCSPARDLFVYATTQATNAILEGKTARTALLCTEGFPDILVRREGGKLHPYDFSRALPRALRPAAAHLRDPRADRRRRRRRRAARRAAARASVARGSRAPRVEAVAVCLLWSIANPAHELALGELIEEELPGRARTRSPTSSTRSCASTAAPRRPRSTPR